MPSMYSGARATTARRALSFFVGVLVASAASARATAVHDTADLVPGNVVARLELQVPHTHDFVVRGTFPVPRATYPRPDGLSPFQVRGPDGTLSPAQTEIVSRYANDALGADVVEVLAHARVPDEIPNGGRVQFDVVYSPCDPGVLVTHPAVDDLLRVKQTVKLTARDVYGNLYVADLEASDAPARAVRDGALCHEWRTTTSFYPVSIAAGQPGPLPHLMGVHAWFRVWDGEPVVSLDLLIHNGHDGHHDDNALDDPAGKLYFDRVDLWLPDGWTAVQDDPDLYAGDPEQMGSFVRVPIVRPIGDGTLHVMPIQAQTERRIVLSRDEDRERAFDYARDRNLGFARRGTNGQGEELFSWWNAETARYSTQKMRLPTLDHVPNATIHADVEGLYAWIASTLRTGVAPGYPVLAPALGWAHPWGIDDGGMAGGAEIVFYDGLRGLEIASNEGFRVLAMRHRMLTDRQPVALFDFDGEPSDYTTWTVHGTSGEWLPIWCFLRPILWAADPFGFTTAPTFENDEVAAIHRAPAYEAQLESYAAIDLEHLVRYTAPAKALAWIGNDTLAKASLQLHAALFRMSYNELPNSNYGHYISTGLGSDLNYVGAHPGQGFVFGRLEAWGLDAVTSAYALGDDATRAAWHPWFGRVLDAVSIGQSQCSGIIQANVYEQLFGGHYRARQSIEQAITENALVGLRECVYEGDDDYRTAVVNAVLRASLHAMVTPPCWSDTFHAPWSKLAVGDNDFTHPPFCGAPPSDGYADGGDAYQTWGSLAYGYELTHDPIFLQRASEMITGPLLPYLEAGQLSNLENRAALLGLVQTLAGQ